jgi:pyruvate/2-oxoglutarate dehydrogenase complex dihydrolipoamide acyltransferase (E2) component
VRSAARSHVPYTSGGCLTAQILRGRSGPSAAYSALVPDDLIGAYEIQRLSFRRRMTIDGFDAFPPGHHIMGLLELDITVASERVEALQRTGTRVSLFAFAVACIARALAEHPELNAVRSGRRIVRFEDVDVSASIELETPEGPYPYQLPIRRASTKSPVEIFAELEAARARHATSKPVSHENRFFETMMRWLGLLPRFVRLWLLRRVASSPFAVKRWTGTTFVTSVGKFASAPGFVIPFAAGPMAATFALGSVVDKPVLRGQELRNHPFLALTVIVNHDLVDGGPAARFVHRLQQLVEGGDGLPQDAGAS